MWIPFMLMARDFFHQAGLDNAVTNKGFTSRKKKMVAGPQKLQGMVVGLNSNNDRMC